MPRRPSADNFVEDGKVVTFRLRVDTFEKLRALGFLHKRFISEVIRDAVNEYVRRNEHKIPRDPVTRRSRVA